MPAGESLRESNISPSIGTRGVRAPGVNILTAAPGGAFAPMSGTSAATAFVTGGIARCGPSLLRRPRSEIRNNILRSGTAGPRFDCPAALRRRKDEESTNVQHSNGSTTYVRRQHPERDPGHLSPRIRQLLKSRLMLPARAAAVAANPTRTSRQPGVVSHVCRRIDRGCRPANVHLCDRHGASPFSVALDRKKSSPRSSLLSPLQVSPIRPCCTRR